MAHRLTCLACGTTNRVPAEKLGAGPKCGVCGARLTDGKPHAIDPAILAKAQADTVPLVVDFWAPWCGPCRMMAPEFAQAAAALAPAVRFAKLDTQDHPGPSQALGIRGIPTMIVWQGGRERARQSGAMRAGDIVAWVKGAQAAV